MTTIPDITIAGGGIIGLLTAREFINAGATVALFDKQAIGQEASWAGGGILLPLYPWRQADAISLLVKTSLEIYPTLVAELINHTKLDPERQPCGLLITQNPDADLAITWCKHYQIACLPSGPQLLQSLQTEPNQPLWLPDVAHVRNPRLLKSLKQDLADKGCRFHEHQPVQGIKLETGRIVALTSHQQSFQVNELVIASGAWTSQIFQDYFPDLSSIPDIKPMKGQMLLFDARPDLLPFMVLEGGHYLIPRRDGKILAGSTVEQDGFNKATSNSAFEQLHAFAVGLLPGLKPYPVIQHWAGLRPGTSHGIPYIGRHPEIPNLSINAGHFRNGLVMGPASAKLLVDLALNRPLQISPEPYQLTRPH